MVNVLIGCTGSVATIKLPNLINMLKESHKDLKSNIEVRIVVTEAAKHFISKNELPSNIIVYEDADEWSAWSKRGDPVLHIELGKWAHIFLIAPLDANTLAKISNGYCDNLLTCVARAWERRKPLIFCPAMNSRMYEHPLTSKQICQLKTWGYYLVPVVEKTLMCGDTGTGAMAEINTIVSTVQTFFT
ncbi:phosphopantothenoylcysteine decarboxylase [Agrilus planipennis]|uniref:Phosphopantothenoylcysteine decarboxylase n=1 Tax=Agrilus planipennis TaxID=224129 RepID=A0A1W4WXV5_AGRPL|nr:phosphopantothenoylcysteine decarboxylase [Agrilus planipennis]